MTLERKIVGGTIAVLSSAILARAGIFLANVAVVRVLGTEGVGQLALVDVFLSVVASFSQLGLGLAITRSVALYADRDRDRAGHLIGASYLLVACFCAVTILITWVAIMVPNPVVSGVTQHSLRPLFLPLAGLAITSAVRDMQVSVMYGLQVYRPLVRVNAVLGVASFPALYIPARFFNVEGAVAGRLALVALEVALVTRVARRLLKSNNLRASLGATRADVKELFSFGFGYFVGQLPSAPAHAYLASVLVSQRGGLHEFGLYATANRLAFLGNFVPAAMATTFLPLLATEWRGEDQARYSVATSSALRLIVMITLPVIVFLASTSPLSLRLLYGREYESSWPIAFVLLVLTLLMAFNEPIDRAYGAAGRIWLSSANNYIGAVFIIALGLVLIPRHLGFGYSLAFAVAFVAYLAIQIYRLRRALGLKLYGLTTLVAIAACSLGLALGMSAAFKNSSVALIAGSCLLTAMSAGVLYRLVLAADERAKFVQMIGTRLRRGGTPGNEEALDV